jgi:hypothetical protein
VCDLTDLIIRIIYRMIAVGNIKWQGSGWAKNRTKTVAWSNTLDLTFFWMPCPTKFCDTLIHNLMRSSNLVKIKDFSPKIWFPCNRCSKTLIRWLPRRISICSRNRCSCSRKVLFNNQLNHSYFTRSYHLNTQVLTRM